MINYNKRPIIAESDRKERVKCGCGKIFENKRRRGVLICPNCKEKVDREYAALIDYRRIHFLNRSTQMFINEDSIKISCTMISAKMLEKCCFDLSEVYYGIYFKYNLKTRRSVMYSRVLDIRPESSYSKSNTKFFRFINITQPTETTKRELGNIKLPKELIKDFLNVFGIEATKDDYSLTPFDLAWINRLRLPVSECLAQAEYYERFKALLDLEMDVAPHQSICFNTTSPSNIKELKTLINKHKKAYATLNMDEAFKKAQIEKYCEYKTTVQIKELDKSLLKEYHKNPQNLGSAGLIHSLFKNKDIVKNTINLRNIWGCSRNYDKAKEFYRYVKIPNEEMLSEEQISDKKEKILFNKIKSCKQECSLDDTVRMLKQIYLLGVDFSMKGSLEEVHDRASETIRRFEGNKYKFPEVDGFEEFEFKNGIIKRALTGAELWDIGGYMNICVGSYDSYCMSENMVICYIQNKKANEYIGCLEFEKINTSYILRQAKYFSNSLLPKKLQLGVKEFCLKNGFKVDTMDLTIKLEDEYIWRYGIRKHPMMI